MAKERFVFMRSVPNARWFSWASEIGELLGTPKEAISKAIEHAENHDQVHIIHGGDGKHIASVSLADSHKDGRVQIRVSEAKLMELLS